MIYKSKFFYAGCALALSFAFNAANAQSIGSFATRPLMNNDVPPPPPNTIEMPIAKQVAAPISVPISNSPAPVTMFRQTNFPEPEPQTISGENPNYIQNNISSPNTNIAPIAPNNYSPTNYAPTNYAPVMAAPAVPKRKRRFWEPLELPTTPAPSILEPAKGLYRDITMDVDTPIDSRRGPMKAIVQDSSRALRRDVPQALADALPWVDNARKQEPFESVLARVTDNLSRANASDPEWANPAQSEIRELATRLDRLSSPPQYRAEYQELPIAHQASDVHTARPFYTRPIWPGARPVSEGQLRPVAIVSNTDSEIGINASGRNIEVPPEASEETKPKPQSRQSRRRR